MRKKGTRRRTTRALLCLAALLTVTSLVTGCPKPVDPEADVYVRGKVVDLDGETPWANQTVELFKSTSPFWVYGSWLERILENGSHFRTTRTNADGEFEFHMKGKDANTPNGAWAAWFVVAVFHDNDREMAVVTEDHHFSDEDLIWSTPEMYFWGTGEEEVVMEEGVIKSMNFSWQEMPKNRTHDYLFYIDDGGWAQWVGKDETRLDGVPVEVFNTKRTDSSTWQMIAWSTGLRYRSSKRAFGNPNTREPISGTKATDGAGNDLPGLTDGEYTDKQHFTEATDDKTVILDLGADHDVDTFLVTHGWITSFWHGTAKISTATATAGDNYVEWATVQGDEEKKNWGLFYHYIQGPVRRCQYIRIDLSGTSDVKFHYLGEMVAYGSSSTP